MSNAVRWAIAGYFVAWGIYELVLGVGLLLRFDERILAGMSFDPVEDARGLLVTLAGVLLMLFGVFLGFTAWGIYRWHRWARVVVILTCVYNLGLLAYWAYWGGPQSLIGGVVSLGVLFWAFHPEVQQRFVAKGVA